MTGDGSRTIRQLVDQANADPRRGDGHARALTRIQLDDGGGQAPGRPPGWAPVGAGRWRARHAAPNANLSTGGTSRDVTDLVHEDVAELCRRAAAAAGLDICGVDIRLADISAPLPAGESRPAAGHGSRPAGHGQRPAAR